MARQGLIGQSVQGLENRINQKARKSCLLASPFQRLSEKWGWGCTYLGSVCLISEIRYIALNCESNILCCKAIQDSNNVCIYKHSVYIMSQVGVL